MKPYEWMVKYTPQTEWIEGRGLLLCLAFFLGGVGGGLYIVSLFFNNFTGMIVGLLIVAVLKGGAHFAFLGKPLRFWRIIARPQTSWISRGFIFIVAFVLFGFIQLCLSYWLPGTVWEVVFKVLAGMAAFGQSIYTGFTLSYVNGVKFWNSTLVPILFITCALNGGLGLLLGISFGSANVEAIENISRVLLIAYAVMVAVHLWSSTYIDCVAKGSVMSLIRGKNGIVFWGGVVTLGILIPVVISFATYFTGQTTVPLLIIAIVCETIGAFALRYAILKAGWYMPLIALTH